jgi:hypothetical protein
MKLDVRVAPSTHAREALARDPSAGALIDLDQIAFVLDADGEPLKKLLEATRTTDGSLFFPVLHFDREETASAPLVQPQSRKVVRETDRDYRLNNGRMKEMAPVLASEGFQTKLLDRVALSKIDLKPDTIAVLGEWTLEYLTSSPVVERLREPGLTGLEALPVFNPRTRADHEGIVQLCSRSLMPRLARDGMVRRQQAEKGPEVSFRQFGCLCYPSGTAKRCQDFNRTAEPFTWFGGPEWVLSQRVRECYEHHKLKGWEFLPVLEEGMALHRDLMTRLGRSCEQVRQNPNNLL